MERCNEAAQSSPRCALSAENVSGAETWWVKVLPPGKTWQFSLLNFSLCKASSVPIRWFVVISSSLWCVVLRVFGGADRSPACQHRLETEVRAPRVRKIKIGVRSCRIHNAQVIVLTKIMDKENKEWSNKETGIYPGPENLPNILYASDLWWKYHNENRRYLHSVSYVYVLQKSASDLQRGDLANWCYWNKIPAVF